VNEGRLAIELMSPCKKTGCKQSTRDAVFYNHPLDDQQPTRADHKITEAMIEAGRLMQIPQKDHVIIGKDWFSFFERDCREDD
jgi:DNA repair protein RadC